MIKYLYDYTKVHTSMRHNDIKLKTNNVYTSSSSIIIYFIVFNNSNVKKTISCNN